MNRLCGVINITVLGKFFRPECAISFLSCVILSYGGLLLSIASFCAYTLIPGFVTMMLPYAIQFIHLSE